ncbi:MAG: dTDP-4-dehydrorhamnose 3,5-epimerase [Clostridia bacterium]|nr:dTDP-4-dehydrorhamnose 3,5-epimerase [Clostridia bacterium]
MGKWTAVRDPGGIEGLCLLVPHLYRDARGSFMETYHAPSLARLGLSARFVQENQSVSRKGVLRGLHLQRRHPQGKLVRVLAGEVFDVAVDLRRASPTYGAWYGITLSAENRRQLYLPPGFAHGFLSLREGTTLLYRCTEVYHPEDEAGVLWCDRELGIRWPGVCLRDGEYVLCDGTPLLLSEKDRAAKPFSEILSL